MTLPDRKNGFGDLMDSTGKAQGKKAANLPVSSDNAQASAENNSEMLQPALDLQSMQQDQAICDSKTNAIDYVETPRADRAGYATTLPVKAMSEAVQNTIEQQPTGHVCSVASPGKIDYFAAQVPPQVQEVSPSITGNPTSRESSIPASPDNSSVARSDFSRPYQSSSTFTQANARPTSVPNFQSRTLSRRREGPEYPNYPDQSFRALQDPHSPIAHRPVSPRRLRTQKSHLSQGSSSPGESRQLTDVPRVPSGAKSLGNTPAQSPGLFSPTYSANRQSLKDSDEARSNTTMLHPAHQEPPKETHKLQKDVDPISGRKTINHYEVFQKLGSGQHGTVKQGRDLDSGAMVAIKIVRRFSKRLRLGRAGDPNDMIKKEVAILKKARHPHVVSLIEVIDDDEFGKVYLVLEFVDRGEIIWRKQTDKDICAFEMARTRRELAGQIDEHFERNAALEFNKAVPARRLEKARLLEQRRSEEVKSHSSNYDSQSLREPDLGAYFSPFERPRSEIGFETQAQIQPGEEHSYQVVESSSQNQSPNYTPRPPPQSVRAGSIPASASSSRPRSPVSLEGTMYGPYLEERWPELSLQTTLDKIVEAQTHWSEEEEDFRYVPCLTLAQARDAFRDTVLGLEYLHYQGIIHRDIKPANLLWTSDYRVKISDFGVSYLGKPIREDENHEEIPEVDAANLDEAIELAKTVGTPAFYAPELCDPRYYEGGKHSGRPAITGQIDVWALGVTLYGMVFGRLPFFHRNEFQMYEKIASEKIYIPRKRLKGVEHIDKTPSHANKRLDDVVDHEDVDKELRDLLHRLLHKEPSKRITLKEVKHHPWVLQGISDHMSWMDETDPSLQSQGRKIEVSTQEVQDAVVGLTVFGRLKHGFQRVGSALRGRGSRKRADSNPKVAQPEPADPVAPLVEPKVKSTLNDPRTPSLNSTDQIYTALQSSRTTPEHPLAQSVAVSPELRSDFDYFDESRPARPISDPQASRPSYTERTLSTTDSMRTVRAPGPLPYYETLPSAAPPGDNFSSTTTVPEIAPSSSSSLGGIFGGATSRLVNSMRSRDRGSGRQSPSQSSRSSSIDRSAEDPHASPSLALSSAIAAGHVDHPLALRQTSQIPHALSIETTSEGPKRTREQNSRRQTFEFQGHQRRPTVSTAAETACPPSPGDEIFHGQQRPTSAADSISGFQVSSSSDQIISGESTVQSRIPSVVSGTSSLSAPIEEMDDLRSIQFGKVSSATFGQETSSQLHTQQAKGALSNQESTATAAAEDEAGYNGEGEQDSDSEDEGLAMA